MRISDWSSDVCSSDLEHNDAFLYGAGDAKLGSIIGKGARAGAQLRARFLAKFPALAKLIKAVKAAAKKGWLKGLDGRKIPVRSEHAALNSLLQSAGAVICKQWICDAEDALVAAGLKHGNVTGMSDLSPLAKHLD